MGGLHHRNLVNLVGQTIEKGQHMVMYGYMSKGSLSSHLLVETKKRKEKVQNQRVGGIGQLHPTLVYAAFESKRRFQVSWSVGQLFSVLVNTGFDVLTVFTLFK